MLSVNKLILLSVIIGAILSCNNAEQSSLAEEKVKILALHNAQRDFHFNKDSIAFVDQLSDDFISVNKGVVEKPERSATLSRYHNYFSSVEFVKWDDVTEPIIRFSEDGSMAYTIVDKIVVVTYEDEDGNKQESETHFAWTAIYTQHDGEWKIDCVTSTNK